MTVRTEIASIFGTEGFLLMSDLLAELELLIKAARKYERGDTDFPAYATAQVLSRSKTEIERLQAQPPRCRCDDSATCEVEHLREQLVKRNYALKDIDKWLDKMGYHHRREMVQRALTDEKRCICQDQHRRGYCTEPTCPYSNPLTSCK